MNELSVTIGTKTHHYDPTRPARCCCGWRVGFGPYVRAAWETHIFDILRTRCDALDKANHRSHVHVSIQTDRP